MSVYINYIMEECEVGRDLELFLDGDFWVEVEGDGF